MRETFINIIDYLKNPILEKDPNTDLNYRFKIFFQILIINILAGFTIGLLISVLEELNLIRIENHKIEEIVKKLDYFSLIMLAAVIIPIIEELIFRAPITSFEKPKSFKFAFYLFALIFGFVHITNYELSTRIILLSPLLTLPQIVAGGLLGYIRVRFGLRWAMLLHGMSNAIILTMAFVSK